MAAETELVMAITSTGAEAVGALVAGTDAGMVGVVVSRPISSKLSTASEFQSFMMLLPSTAKYLSEKGYASSSHLTKSWHQCS